MQWPWSRTNGHTALAEAAAPAAADATIRECRHCGDAPLMAHGRCSPCYQYWRKHGVDRAPDLVERTRQIRARREISIAQWEAQHATACPTCHGSGRVPITLEISTANIITVDERDL